MNIAATLAGQNCIPDSAGCMLAGTDGPCSQTVGKAAPAGAHAGDRPVFGAKRRVGPLDAAVRQLENVPHLSDFGDEMPPPLAMTVE